MEPKNVEDLMEDKSRNPVISGLSFTASYSGSMDGGIVTGGTAKSIINLTPPVSYGGSMVGGSANYRLTLPYTMSGGISVKGSYDVSGSFTYIAVSLEGEAGVRVTYRPNCLGGTSLGGSATTGLGFQYNMNGGLSLSGQSRTNQDYSHTMSGGIAMNGQAVQQVSVIFFGSGGVGLEGSVLTGASYVYTGTGGVVTSGQFSSIPKLNYVSKGGIITGGQASVQLVIYHTMSGGIVTAGSIATPRFSLTYEGSGGKNLGGSSRAVWGKAYTMTGGIFAGGQNGNGLGLQVNYRYKPEFPHNRIFVYGKGSYESDSFYHIMTGGVVMGGLGKIDFCAISCDTEYAFYRDSESQNGCRVVLPNGKVNFTCARPIFYSSSDKSNRSPGGSALVASATVCRQGLTKNNQRTNSNCENFIRK